MTSLYDVTLSTARLVIKITVMLCQANLKKINLWGFSVYNVVEILDKMINIYETYYYKYCHRHME